MSQPALTRFRFSSAVEVARALSAQGPRTACGHPEWTDDCAPAGSPCPRRDDCVVAGGPRE